MKNKKVGPKAVMKTASSLKSKAVDVSRKKKPMHVDKVDSRAENSVSKKKKEKAKAEKALEFSVDRSKKSKRLEKLVAEPVSKKDSKKMGKMSAQLAVLGDLKPKQAQEAIKEKFGEAAPPGFRR